MLYFFLFTSDPDPSSGFSFTRRVANSEQAVGAVVTTAFVQRGRWDQQMPSFCIFHSNKWQVVSATCSQMQHKDQINSLTAAFESKIETGKFIVKKKKKERNLNGCRVAFVSALKVNTYFVSFMGQLCVHVVF